MKFMKRLLRRNQRVYRFVQRFYYKALYIIEVHVFGSRLHEWIWRRTVHKITSGTYSDDINHPHREYLLNVVKNAYPFESVLEIGCNSGPNLLKFSQCFPQVLFYGLDINEDAIRKGRECLKERGVRNVDLSVGKADELSLFSDKSVDISFTDATLLYLGPDKIERVFKEMIRITRKKLFFNEWNLRDDHEVCSASQWENLHWIHNYKRLLSRHVASENIHITALPSKQWGAGSWEEFGALVEVDLQPIQK